MWKTLRMRLFGRFCLQLDSLDCSLGRHDAVPERDGRTVFMRCLRCRRRTEGVPIEGRPKQLLPGKPEFHRLAPIVVTPDPSFDALIDLLLRDEDVDHVVLVSPVDTVH